MYRHLALLALLVLPLLHACGEAPANVEQPVRPVKTMVVGAVNHGRMWSFAGTAEDALETDLSFRVGGKVVAFPGDQIGRKFAEGDVIAKLDPSDYELELRQARANYEQVRANYVRAKADMQRNSQLFERNVISRGELDQIEADFKSFEAQLSASAKKVEIARKHLNYTTLQAPFDGWIGRVKTQIHQNVSAGQSVVSFNAGRQMKMYIAVPDILISRVNEGDRVEVRFDALPGKVMEGKVMEVSVDSSVGSTYPVKVYLDNDEKLIRSGMSGHVIFMNKGDAEARYYLPTEAVVGEANGSRTIWVVNPDNATVESRAVTIGKLDAAGLEILEGVKPGDIVVTRGVHHLKEGLKVRYTKPGAEG